MPAAPALTLVLGDEDLLVARAVEDVVRRACAADPGAEVTDAQAGDLSAGELSALLSPSLFAEARVVVLRAAEELPKDLLGELTACAADIPVGMSLVVLHRGGVTGKAVAEAMKKAGAALVEAPKIKRDRDREDFVAAEFRRAGAMADREAVLELVATVGSDLRELATAAAQLVADVGPHLTVDDVAAQHQGRPETKAFAVADRAVEGNVAAAVEQLRWAYSVGVEPVQVNGALAANLRAIGLVGGARRGSPDQIAASVGLHPWKVRTAQGWLRRWSPTALAEAVQVVRDADATVKSNAGDSRYAVERAVLRVAQAAGGTS